ncbi:MAG: hypothetical protein EOO23_07930, partial [Comamonadaceae bacterium]
MEAFVGTIMSVGFNFAPRGWALCNGQLMSISQNSALFSLLGTTYGGDGVTSFGLPDLRGRVAVGAQQPGPGLTPIQMGDKSGTNNVTVIGTGAASVSLTTANLPAHNHSGSGMTATTTITQGHKGRPCRNTRMAQDKHINNLPDREERIAIPRQASSPLPQRLPKSIHNRAQLLRDHQTRAKGQTNGSRAFDRTRSIPLSRGSRQELLFGGQRVSVVYSDR